MRLSVLLYAFLFLFTISTYSQDYVRIMGYNLLYYGSYTSFCTEENNNHRTKADYLKTIFEYVKPDIMAVTEISPNQYYSNYLLGHCFNTGGITSFRAVPVSNLSGGSLANGLFYDSNKFEYIKQHIIETDIRDVNIYKLRYLLAEEPIYINIMVGHLKAGNTAADREARANMIQSVLDYLDEIGYSSNYLVMGDLNVYSSNENAYQILINPEEGNSLTFYDPLEEHGNWHLNPNFSNIHTQSTRTENYNPCFVTGGLDDRFDFILIDESIKKGLKGVHYKQDSYTTVGQDGNRFNSSLIEPVNTSAPNYVIDALYNMSDHLPVYADFYFGDNANSSITNSLQCNYIMATNPIKSEFEFKIKHELNDIVKIKIYSALGVKIVSKKINATEDSCVNICANDLPQGVYIVNIFNNNFKESIKIIKM